MKRVLFVLTLSLAIVTGLVFARREIKNETRQNSTATRSASETKAILKKWETTAEGVEFRAWQASPVGQHVLAGAARIQQYIRDSTDMEAVVTSLRLPPRSQLGFGMMVRINRDEYILCFRAENPTELQGLYGVNAGDRIIIRSHFVSYAPKYSYPIVTGNYVTRDGKILYKRKPREDGC
ncbi:MAG: hypothetical protein JNL17_04955 [Cyclobacteriaceae bacterium]|nr:hypothetical protein [Cyclobacteriaceae bacterium]